MAGPPPSPIAREFRAAWVATVDNIDWPSKRDLTPQAQRREMIQILDTLQSLRMNAAIFQIRPSADALYPSRIEPWSEYLTGRQGTPPVPEYDPLEFTIQEARKRGIEVHVWINPYRANHPAQKGPLAENHIGRTHPDFVETYARFLWMNPAEDFVQKRTLEVVRDVVRRYDIDGVHIDDYFYPYPVEGTPFPDADNYAAYRQGGGNLSLGDWRRKNVDDFVLALHKNIKSVKPWVRFGISPFGIYRPGVPAGIRAGVDQYDQLYADALKWFREGWCDYYSPQLYWPIAQTAQSFPVLLNWWETQNAKRIHLWPGLFTSRTNPASGNWPAKEVTDQIALIRGSRATGAVHFSMKALMLDWNGIRSALRKTYAEVALPPATTWIEAKRPEAPQMKENHSEGATWVMRVESPNDPDVRLYAYSLGTASGGTVQWGSWRLSPSGSLRLTAAEGTNRVAVVAVDRVGNESSPLLAVRR